MDERTMEGLVRQYRRALHQIPELDRELPETVRYVEQVLAPLGCQVFSPAQGAVCAWFDGGKAETVAFRADMDALPVTEHSSAPYCSRHSGVMHACGHDGHTAMLLALAHVVDQRLAELPRNVLLIFQPAEETDGGAKEICDSGVLRKYRVSRIFGLHLWPGLPMGSIWSGPGPIMAQNSELDLLIEGRSAHITKRHLGVDALWIGAEALRRIYEMEAEELPREEMRVLRFGKMVSGTVRNVVSNRTQLEGTVRVFSQATFDHLARRMREIAADLEREYGCRISVYFSEGYPSVTNDPGLLQAVEGYLGPGAVGRMDQPELGVDDFSFYQLHVPGVYAFLGLGNAPALHANTFDFDERALVYGVRYYEKLLFLP